VRRRYPSGLRRRGRRGGGRRRRGRQNRRRETGNEGPVETRAGFRCALARPSKKPTRLLFPRCPLDPRPRLRGRLRGCLCVELRVGRGSRGTEATARSKLSFLCRLAASGLGNGFVAKPYADRD
jgi:hypothetical protein